MRLRLIYFAITFVLLIAGLYIFNHTNHIPFIRNSVGDFLVVIFMYTFAKMIQPRLNSWKLVLGILIFSVSIEFLQLLKVPHYFGTDKKWVKLFLGSNFEWLDILAYILGLLFVYYLDRYIKKGKILTSKTN